MSVPPLVRAARAAVVLLTRVPVGGFPFSAAEWRWASAWFPLVGALLGIVLAAVWSAIVPLGVLPTATVVVATGIWLTGAFHEDGLADTVDALGGGADREHVLAILKDSRIGAFGALAVTLSIVLRVALLAELAAAAPAALVLAHCVSRCPPVWLLATLPYVTAAEEAKSRMVARASWFQVAFATQWAVLVMSALVATRHLSLGAAVLVSAAAVVVGLVGGRRFQRRVGGLTGDFLGAVEQAGECVVLLALVAARQMDW